MNDDELSDRINSLFEREEWKKARELLKAELKKAPQSHWVLDRLSVTYYEQRDYRSALSLIKRASRIAPECPLVLWDYAGTCAALGRTKEAIQKYQALIAIYPDGFSTDDCNEGEEWASSLLLDCLFRIGVCFAALKANETACLFFEDYIDLRTKNKAIPSLYSIAEAQKKKAQVEGRKVNHAPGSILQGARRARQILAGCA